MAPNPHLTILLLFGALIALASASSAPTFCKCTCFKNSTIIPLGPHPQPAPPAPPAQPQPQFQKSTAAGPNLGARSASASCSQCTKAFCLGQHIAFCVDATEADVQTLCFQRDSNKDRIIVWGFIVGAGGLLGWALFWRVVEWRAGRRSGSGGQDRGGYAVLGPDAD